MLTPALQAALAAGFAAHPDLEPVAPARLATTPVGGGCINQGARLDTPLGPFFLKTNRTAPPSLFDAEARGLALLRAAPGGPRVPRPLVVGEAAPPAPRAAAGRPAFRRAEPAEPAPPRRGDDGVVRVAAPEPFLLLEHVAAARPAPDAAGLLGEQLAALHRSTAPRFGLDHDNFIGSTPQPNGWMDGWVEFFAVRRIEPQLRLARDLGRADAGLVRAADRLLERLHDLIGDPAEPPALLHGDLWAGNAIHGPDGEPVILDPAAYFGRREADLAMMELFGGFPPACFAAYRAAWPLAEGYAERRDVYNLYHLLNHLNLFGDSYEGQVTAVLRRYGG